MSKMQFISYNKCPLVFWSPYLHLWYGEAQNRYKYFQKIKAPTFSPIITPLCTINFKFSIFAMIILCHGVYIFAMCYGHEAASEITIENIAALFTFSDWLHVLFKQPDPAYFEYRWLQRASLAHLTEAAKHRLSMLLMSIVRKKEGWSLNITLARVKSILCSVR